MERILIIGRGFLGESIVNEFADLEYKIGATRFLNIGKGDFQVDVRDIGSINTCIKKFKPDIIINCAANTQLDFLEENPKIAFSINAEGAKNVATVCEREKIRLFHISTDGIFDGKKGSYNEQDKPNPLNVYAKSKFLAEKYVSEKCSDYVIIRTNFYGNNCDGKFLFNWVYNNLKRNKTFIGFADIVFTPLEITNLSKMIAELANKKFHGIIHLAASRPINKYEFALKVGEIFNISTNLIKKGSVEDLKLKALRPKNTSLSNEKSKSFLKTKEISLEEWLTSTKSKLG